MLASLLIVSVMTLISVVLIGAIKVVYYHAIKLMTKTTMLPHHNIVVSHEYLISLFPLGSHWGQQSKAHP